MRTHSLLHWRRVAAAAALLVSMLAGSAVAQDGLVVNGRYVSASRSFGADLGPAPSDFNFPLAGGGRFLVNGNTITDRRTGQRMEIPAHAVVVAADPVRPRVFVRYDGLPFAAIAEFNLLTATSRLLTLVASPQARWQDLVRYAYSADRLFFDISDGVPGDPTAVIAHPVRIIDGTSGADVGTFSVDLSDGSRWLVSPDGSRAYFSSRTLVAGRTEWLVKAVHVADGTTTVHAIGVPTFSSPTLQWDEVNDRLFVSTFDFLQVLSKDLGVVGQAPDLGTYAIGVSPHTERLYVASGRFSVFGGDVNLSVFDSRTFTWLGSASLGRGGGVALALVTPPGPPRALRATVTGGNVDLAWTDVGAASHIVLDVGVAPGRTDLSVFLGPDSHASFTSVPPGTYYLRLRGGNEFGGGRTSSEVRVVVP